jgi:BirA family transcriptional regulator, biotin operon repressor / biotin---[acetyl-CoA-carboxylase] ligase
MLQFADLDCNNILILSSIDSTNNYAQRIINNNEPFYTIVQALNQTAGKGQRNNVWQSEANSNLLMSIILEHQHSSIASQFVLNMAVCLGILDCIKLYIHHKKCTIKWSNDIYIEDKKIAGVLIENNIRGNTWINSIIGIGININSTFYNTDLPNPTSVLLETNLDTDLTIFRNKLLDCIAKQLIIAKQNEPKIITDYNYNLYKKNEWHPFENNNKIEKFLIDSVNEYGQIVLHNGSAIKAFSYAEIKQIILQQ